MTGPRYVQQAALVDGFAAHVVDRVLARHLPPLLEVFTPEQRAEVDAARAAIRAAAKAWESAPMSVSGPADTPGADIAASSPDELTAAQAADLLGVSVRHARRLAASGMGRLVAGVWLLDRSALLAYRQGRRIA
ncbi:MAG TPA: helix-turn-helix domain-containing protein [Streptosporangiaceae bacterium]